jgi:4a-hydroxytetrahydrobiopterin dehydratase
MNRDALLAASCRHLTEAATEQQLTDALTVLSDWVCADGQLQRQFQFADYHQTMAFVNAVADIAHHEDHHPEMVVGYNRCTVRYSTHSVNQGKGGLSHNDFICAAKIDQISLQRA